MANNDRGLSMAQRIWAELWADLGGRRGFRQAWNAHHTGAKHEITETMVGIIDNKLNGDLLSNMGERQQAVFEEIEEELARR